jgi:N-acetylglutamate synthase-like GNAT family acetyltransferase
VNFVYVPATKTNVLDTLKKFGFEPPSESKWMQEKWTRYRNCLAINNGELKK